MRIAPSINIKNQQHNLTKHPQRPMPYFAFARTCLIFALTLLAAECITIGSKNLAHAQNLNLQNRPYTQTSQTSNSTHIPTPLHKNSDNGNDNGKTSPPPLSALEKAYSSRIKDAPAQYGYDLFNESRANSTPTAPMGALQDNFVLGAGDELLITFTGQRNDQNTYKIPPHGNLVIKDLPPLPATGKTIANLRHLLNAGLESANMRNTQAYISLSKVRQIGVLVVGHVKNPGRKTLSAFHNIIDALNMAQGISKNGSLRKVKLVRAGHSTLIDLYSLLHDGNTPDTKITLRDADRIIVPPIGPTIAISGAVKRPGIYEIFPNTQKTKLSLNNLLDMAGGLLVPGKNRFIRYAPDTGGHENIEEINDFSTPIFDNGNILSVMSGKAKQKGMIKLSGETARPGLYDLSHNKKLSELLSNPSILGENIYPLLGIIKRWDTEQLSTRFISFPLRSVLKSEFDINLADNDVVILLSNKDIETISATYNSKTPNSENQDNNPAKTNNIFKNDKALEIYLKEHSLHVRGAVLRPGHYPVAQGITLENILASAGGMTLEANPASIEITSANFGTNGQTNSRSGTQRMTISLNNTPASSYILSAGDSVRVNQQYRKLKEKSVRINGEILHPGEYDLLPGDTVLSLIKRAGGLSQQAYPAGAIFSRESERRTQELGFRKAARDMQRALATAIKNDKEDRPDATQIEMARSLARELENIKAVGRITIEADPAVLTTKPELDMLLEHGDRIHIPKRPLSVRVTGEVLSPSSLQFTQNKTPLEYIRQAGNFTFHADKNRTFVLYPDGSAQPLQVSKWNHKPVFIPPGSTIIVPRDPKPFDFIQGAKEIGQILSNLAVTAVFIDDIRD